METALDLNAIGLDFSVDMDWTAENFDPTLTLQGNLDPVELLTGGDNLKREATRILESMTDRPFIFNLGHGVIKETPPEHVEQLCEIIRNF